jgi:Tfp pilus assembly protein PilO
MVLQKREKILAIIIVSLLTLLAIYWLWPSSGGSLADLRRQCDELEKKVANQKLQVQQSKTAAARLEQWRRRSLPAESATARSLYQSWLHQLASGLKFKNLNITPSDAQSVRKIYAAFRYTITCQGSLEQLTKFLHGFYSAGHLHKITNLIITPTKDSSDLKFDITVEALSLPDSKQTDKLSDETSKRLKLASLEDYSKLIVGRNLFAAYVPKPPANVVKNNAPREPKIDPLQFSFLTAIIEADGVPEAWVWERTTNETHKLHVGEEFNIGKVRGKVNRIGYNDIEIEIDGQSHTVNYGSNLRFDDKKPKQDEKKDSGAEPGPFSREPTASAKQANSITRDQVPAEDGAGSAKRDSSISPVPVPAVYGTGNANKE